MEAQKTGKSYANRIKKEGWLYSILRLNFRNNPFK